MNKETQILVSLAQVASENQGVQFIMKVIVFSLAAMILFFSADARADGFKTPSGNIECEVGMSDEYEVSEKVLYCTIFTVTKETDGSCGLSSPRTITLFGAGNNTTTFSCAGQRSSVELPIVDYGKMWQSSEFSCAIANSGVTCNNQNGNTFFLSKAMQKWGEPVDGEVQTQELLEQGDQNQVQENELQSFQESPVRCSKSQLGNTSVITCDVTANNVMLNDVILNRGNCVMLTSSMNDWRVQDNRGKMYNFGDRFSLYTNNCNLIEYSIRLNNQIWTWQL